MKKIKIKSCKSPSYWYKHLVGKEIDVTKFDSVSGDAIIKGKELKKLEPENSETSVAFVCRQDFDLMPDVVGLILGTEIRIIKKGGGFDIYPEDIEKFKAYNGPTKIDLRDQSEIGMLNEAVKIGAVAGEMSRDFFDMMYGDTVRFINSLDKEADEMNERFEKAFLEAMDDAYHKELFDEIKSFARSRPLPFDSLVKNWFNSDNFGKDGERKDLTYDLGRCGCKLGSYYMRDKEAALSFFFDNMVENDSIDFSKWSLKENESVFDMIRRVMNQTSESIGSKVKMEDLCRKEADEAFEKAQKESLKFPPSCGWGIPVFNPIAFDATGWGIGMDFGKEESDSSILKVTEIDLNAESVAKMFGAKSSIIFESPEEFNANMVSGKNAYKRNWRIDANQQKEKNKKIIDFIKNEAFVTVDQIVELIDVFESEDNPLESNSNAYAKIRENMSDQLKIALDEALNSIADFKTSLNAK